MRRKISEMKGGDVTKSDYRLLGLVAVALAFAFILNACLGVTVTRRAGAAAPGDEAVTLINAYRAGLGLAPLRTDARLVGAADFHNRWMRDNDCFAHQCPNEPGPGDRATAAGYPSAAVGEVIGRGYQDAAAVVTGWRNSPGHDAILRGRYVDIGCAGLVDSGGPWWTCDFGTAGTGRTPPPTASPGPPKPTPTLDRRGPLPAGWLMRVYIVDGSLPQCSMVGVGCYRLLEIDYDHTTWVVTDGLYGQYCTRGYRCEWLRKPVGWRPQAETSGVTMEAR